MAIHFFASFLKSTMCRYDNLLLFDWLAYTQDECVFQTCLRSTPPPRMREILCRKTVGRKEWPWRNLDEKKPRLNGLSSLNLDFSLVRILISTKKMTEKKTDELFPLKSPTHSLLDLPLRRGKHEWPLKILKIPVIFLAVSDQGPFQGLP